MLLPGAFSMTITVGTSSTGEVAEACWDGGAACWCLIRHRSQVIGHDVGWHSYLGTSHATVRLVSGKEQRSLLWIGNLDGVLGVTWRGFSFFLSQGRGASHGYVHCSAVQSHLCSVLWGLQPQNLLMVLVPAQPKKGMQEWSCCTGFKDSEALLPAGVSRPLLLQHSSYPKK